MFIWWGPELVQIFNDAYRQAFGEGDRHVRALGARGTEFWSDIWHIIGPQVDQVMAGGESTWHEDELVPILRNGHREEVWWTYGFSPIRNDHGSVGGVLVVCQETTARVLSDIEREWLDDAKHAAERRAASVLERMSDAHFVLDNEFRHLTVNLAMERGLGVRREELIGRPIWDVFPAFLGSEFEMEFRRVARDRSDAHFTQPYRDEKMDIVADVDVYPAEDDGIAVFWRDVSARSRAESLLRLREAETRTLADAIPTLAWMARPDGYIDWYNARWYEYTGTTPAQMEGWGWQSVHDPRILPDVLTRWRSSIASGDRLR